MRSPSAIQMSRPSMRSMCGTWSWQRGRHTARVQMSGGSVRWVSTSMTREAVEQVGRGGLGVSGDDGHGGLRARDGRSAVVRARGQVPMTPAASRSVEVARPRPSCPPRTLVVVLTERGARACGSSDRRRRSGTAAPGMGWVPTTGWSTGSKKPRAAICGCSERAAGSVARPAGHACRDERRRGVVERSACAAHAAIGVVEFGRAWPGGARTTDRETRIGRQVGAVRAARARAATGSSVATDSASQRSLDVGRVEVLRAPPAGCGCRRAPRRGRTPSTRAPARRPRRAPLRTSGASTRQPTPGAITVDQRRRGWRTWRARRRWGRRARAGCAAGRRRGR